MSLPVFPELFLVAPNRREMIEDEYDAAARVMADDLVQLGPALNQWAIDFIDATSDANYSAVSATELAIGTGSKTLTVQSGKRYVTGTFIIIADLAAPTVNWMFGQVTSYDFGTGDLAVYIHRVLGAGTLSAWMVTLSGPQGLAGDGFPSFGGNGDKVLGLNAAATAVEFKPFGYQLIGTLNPAAATSVVFSSIPAAYNDLLMVVSIAKTDSLRFSISHDGSTWSADDFLSGMGSTTAKGGIYVPGRKFDGGVMMRTAEGMTSPAVTTEGTANSRWACTGGINAIRLTPTSGTLTGTATLLGRI